MATHVDQTVLDHATEVVAGRRGDRRKGDPEFLESVSDHPRILMGVDRFTPRG